MNRDLRKLANTKRTSEGHRIKEGYPSLSELREGQLITRHTSEGLSQFIRYHNEVYRVVFTPLTTGKSPKVAAEEGALILDDISSLTDSSGGTADGTIAAISGSGDDADINNNFAELSNKVNLIISKLSEILTRK